MEICADLGIRQVLFWFYKMFFCLELLRPLNCVDSPRASAPTRDKEDLKEKPKYYKLHFENIILIFSKIFFQIFFYSSVCE